MRGIPRAPRLPRREAPVEKLADDHWTIECATQRMTVQSWKKILLAGDDRIWVAGRSRRLVAKRMGFGIVEVSKEPLKE